MLPQFTPPVPVAEPPRAMVAVVAREEVPHSSGAEQDGRCVIFAQMGFSLSDWDAYRTYG